MTPIQYIGYHKTLVFTVDWSNAVNHVAVAFSEEQAEWLAWSLGRAHNVDYKKFDAIPLTRV